MVFKRCVLFTALEHLIYLLSEDKGSANLQTISVSRDIQRSRKWNIVSIASVNLSNMALFLIYLIFGLALANKAPVFLKFHKVGSGTVASCLRGAYKNNASRLEYWKHSRLCGFDAFSHSTLYLYQSMAVEGMYSNCVNASIKQPENRHILAILRNPLEKVISQFVFFNENLVEQFSYSPTLRNISMNIVSDPRGISPSDMKELIQAIKRDPKIHTKYSSPLVINEYEMVFSNNWSTPFVSSRMTRSAALRHLMNDLSTVGVMEHMTSFLYILSRHVNKTLPCTCSANFDHGVWWFNRKHFDTETRPKANKLFSPGVVDVLQAELVFENILYDKALHSHHNMLKRYNISLETASQLWNKVCMSGV